ncbi:ATP-dependent DNA helicase hus2/rqh1-like [Stylophora pistillata]|uniref:ATP-dependent DNA helicase hus2/rqh1-like n=1 Tax=Stylophora pistillata TaxID=50429 RepID=UPI000C0577B4|nr:ATP-dependent DNA helicase hus2/rqh1-like [Stylophora pistillata]
MNQFVSETVFEEIVSIALEYRFQNIQALSEEKKKALHGLINMKDVFTVLPTGHGKSLIFQIQPDLCPQLSVRGYSYPKNPIIVVIFPLKSLMESHIRELQSYGLTGAAVSGDEVNDDAILRGEYSFVFGSPESFLQNEKWRQMLLSKPPQT